jgi:hypothetical protein
MYVLENVRVLKKLFSFGGEEYYKARKESNNHFSGPLKDHNIDLPFPPPSF